MLFLSGGLLYSALQTLILRTSEQPTNSIISNPHVTQEMSPPLSISKSSDSNVLYDNTDWKNTIAEIKLTQDALFVLQQKMDNYNEKVSGLASQFVMFQVYLLLCFK